MIDKELIESILPKMGGDWSNGKVLSFKDCSNGCDQEVKIVEIKIKKQIEHFVIKYPKEEPEKIKHELIGCQRSLKHGLPVPQNYYFDERFLVQSFMGDKTLDKIQLKKTNKNKLALMYNKLGNYLRSFHKNTGVGFGKLRSPNLVGEHKDKQFIKQNLKLEVECLRKSEHYNHKFINSIEKYLLRNADILEKKEQKTSLLHGDYCQSNIISNQKQILAIIDFGDLSMGSPSQDFARLFINNYDTFKWQALISGYGKHDLKEIGFYTVYLCLWQMNGLIEKGKVGGKLRQLEKAVKKVILW